MPLLDIPPDEWKQAKQYFKDNPTAVKFSKKQSSAGVSQSHSFMMVDGKMYAFANRNHISGKEKRWGLLGKGAYRSVKVVQNENGENFAIKVEKENLSDDRKDELKVMKAIKYMLGGLVRKTESPKFKGNKQYTIMALRSGESLGEYINRKATKSLSSIDKLLLSLRICSQVQSTHDYGVIHADLKPDNIMINDTGKIDLIDFGHSVLLEEGQFDVLKKNWKGTPGFYPNDITPDKNYIISFNYDNHELGKVLEMLDIDRSIFLPLARGYAERPDLLSVMTKIVNEIKKDPQYEQHPQKAEIDNIAVEIITRQLMQITPTLMAIKNQDPTADHFKKILPLNISDKLIDILTHSHDIKKDIEAIILQGTDKELQSFFQKDLSKVINEHAKYQSERINTTLKSQNAFFDALQGATDVNPQTQQLIDQMKQFEIATKHNRTVFVKQPNVDFVERSLIFYKKAYQNWQDAEPTFNNPEQKELFDKYMTNLHAMSETRQLTSRVSIKGP